MDDITRIRSPRRSPLRGNDSADPAVAALIELIRSERAVAAAEDPGLPERADPGRVWLLWFAIGATDAVCRLVERESDAERDRVFRQVVAAIFDAECVQSDTDPIQSDPRLIELFESAGAEAVTACMRNDKRLGYYLEALRVCSRRTLS